MTELTDRAFHELCADPAVRRIIDDANRNGGRAAFAFWGILGLGLLFVGAVTWYAIASGWQVTGVIFGSFGVLIVYILAAVPLAMTGRAIKLPVFKILAARQGLDYSPLVQIFPVSAEARAALLGEDPGTESYTDFFSGKFLDASEFATCQAYLLGEKGSRFNGRLFAVGRLQSSVERVIVTPDCPRWVDPATAVRFEEDQAFERAFKVHASDTAAAGALLSPETRHMLVDLRRRGKLRLYAGPGEIFVAIEGRKGFTPGLGFRFRRAEDRLRWMFDDLADSLAMLNRLKAALDGRP
jgi:hypothetical protein